MLPRVPIILPRVLIILTRALIIVARVPFAEDDFLCRNPLELQQPGEDRQLTTSKWECLSGSA